MHVSVLGKRITKPMVSHWNLLKSMYVFSMGSGQSIATSHDLTPNGGLVREIPLFQGNLGW